MYLTSKRLSYTVLLIRNNVVLVDIFKTYMRRERQTKTWDGAMTHCHLRTRREISVVLKNVLVACGVQRRIVEVTVEMYGN